jgi:hypothetical protein
MASAQGHCGMIECAAAEARDQANFLRDRAAEAEDRARRQVCDWVAATRDLLVLPCLLCHECDDKPGGKLTMAGRCDGASLHQRMFI